MTAVAAPPLPRMEHLVAERATSMLDGRLADAYGAPLAFARRSDRPTIAANFVSTLDGVVSYATPEAAGGGEISGFFGPDRFVMSVLRGVADAVLIGAGVMRASPRGTGRAEHIYPPAAASYSEARERLGIAPDRIVVRENISAIEDYVQAADLGFFTSASESFCLSILECMAFGIPSVSTRVGGIPEVTLHEETGLLVPPGDIEGLVAALAALITDPARRARLGAAARQRAESVFTAPNIVAHYLRYYRAVLAADTFDHGGGM